MSQSPHTLFKWKHFSKEIILWAVRWYCQFSVSYRDLVIMLKERGMDASHTTLMRWVHEYAGEFKKRLKKFIKRSNDSYRIDETYIKIKGEWHYLYRAIDSEGNTLDWMLSATRNQEAAEKFLRQVVSNEHSAAPRIISVDKHASYPPAFKALQTEGLIPEVTELRQIKYLNNIIEQDHRFTKKRIRYSQWLQTVKTAEATISGYESIHLIRKGQIPGVARKDFIAQKKFIEDLFDLAA
jgi:transposase, IS6 family